MKYAPLWDVWRSCLFLFKPQYYCYGLGPSWTTFCKAYQCDANSWLLLCLIIEKVQEVKRLTVWQEFSLNLSFYNIATMLQFLGWNGFKIQLLFVFVIIKLRSNNSLVFKFIIPPGPCRLFEVKGLILPPQPKLGRKYLNLDFVEMVGPPWTLT